jgi:hypothetical protein
MDEKITHVSPLSSKDYEKLGMPLTAETVKTGREKSTFRRKLIGVTLAIGAFAGFVGIPKLLGNDGTPTNQINNPSISSTEQDPKRNLDDKSDDINKIKIELENKTP